MSVRIGFRVWSSSPHVIEHVESFELYLSPGYTLTMDITNPEMHIYDPRAPPYTIIGPFIGPFPHPLFPSVQPNQMPPQQGPLSYNTAMPPARGFNTTWQQGRGAHYQAQLPPPDPPVRTYQHQAPRRAPPAA